jgi:predicted amidohydrolase
MNDFRITSVQPDLVWENPAANRMHIEHLLAAVGATDLVLLPEMFTTGFSMEPERIAEPHDVASGETVQWMLRLSKKFDCAIAGSVSIHHEAHYFNRFYWVQPDGQVMWYDKQHLFTLAGEDLHYAAGDAAQVVTFRGWKICLQVCYDLRFPEGARNVKIGDVYGYDVLVYVANWPAVRRHPWQALLVARAIENQCYVAASNRVGEDGNGHAYSGDSVILDARGELLAGLEPGQEGLIHAVCSAELLSDFRRKFPVLGDRK